MTNDELLALGAVVGLGGLLIAVSHESKVPEPTMGGSVFDDEFGLFKKARNRRKAIKKCKPIGGSGASDYSYTRDPKMWCYVAKKNIKLGMKAGELVRKIRYSKGHLERTAKTATGIGPLAAVVDEMRKVPLAQQKRRYNKRCVPCGYKPMRHATWISTSKHSYSKLQPRALRNARWKRKKRKG